MQAGQKKRVQTGVRDAAVLPLFAAAMRQQALADSPPLSATDHVSTGLRGLDAVLRGGLPVAATSLIAARPRVGATSFLFGASLATLKGNLRVAYFCDHLREDQIRGRFVVLESRVNGYRFKAGFISEEDRLSMAAARERIPWSALSIVAQKKVRLIDIDNHLFTYHSHLVVVDLQERAVGGYSKVSELERWVEDLSSIATRYKVAVVVRIVLPQAVEPPNRLELPGIGSVADLFSTVILVHREEVTDPSHVPEAALGHAEAQVVRLGGHDVEPRFVPLRFDQRFAGFLDP
jgi:replicative DNA helicase